MPFTNQVFGNKLKTLRQSFDNSFDDLFNATGIALNELQALESGNRSPSGDEVLILSDYFKCEFSWLLDDEAANPDENAVLLLRSAGGALRASDRHAIAEFLHLCKSEALLEELLEHRPQYDELKFELRSTYLIGQGKDCANQFRRSHGLPPNAIIPDIFGWLRKAGLRVFRRALPGSPISGLFVRHPSAGRCILINFAEDIYRQRFSAAHEVGHALMDEGIPYNVSTREDFVSQKGPELRANSFATCFLMPPELLSKLGTPAQWQRPEKLIEAADRLFVSVPAVLSALRRDNIIDEATRRKIRDMKLRPPEKREPELRGEMTGRQLDRKEALLASGLHDAYVGSAFEAHRRGLISMAKMADMLLVSLQEVSELSDLFAVRHPYD